MQPVGIRELIHRSQTEPENKQKWQEAITEFKKALAVALPTFKEMCEGKRKASVDVVSNTFVGLGLPDDYAPNGQMTDQGKTFHAMLWLNANLDKMAAKIPLLANEKGFRDFRQKKIEKRTREKSVSIDHARINRFLAKIENGKFKTLEEKEKARQLKDTVQHWQDMLDRDTKQLAQWCVPTVGIDLQRLAAETEKLPHVSPDLKPIRAAFIDWIDRIVKPQSSPPKPYREAFNDFLDSLVKPQSPHAMSFFQDARLPTDKFQERFIDFLAEISPGLCNDFGHLRTFLSSLAMGVQNNASKVMDICTSLQALEDTNSQIAKLNGNPHSPTEIPPPLFSDSLAYYLESTAACLLTSKDVKLARINGLRDQLNQALDQKKDAINQLWTDKVREIATSAQIDSSRLETEAKLMPIHSDFDNLEIQDKIQNFARATDRVNALFEFIDYMEDRGMQTHILLCLVRMPQDPRYKDLLEVQKLFGLLVEQNEYYIKIREEKEQAFESTVNDLKKQLRDLDPENALLMDCKPDFSEYVDVFKMMAPPQNHAAVQQGQAAPLLPTEVAPVQTAAPTPAPAVAAPTAVAAPAPALVATNPTALAAPAPASPAPPKPTATPASALTPAVTKPTGISTLAPAPTPATPSVAPPVQTAVPAPVAVAAPAKHVATSTPASPPKVAAASTSKPKQGRIAQFFQKIKSWFFSLFSRFLGLFKKAR